MYYFPCPFCQHYSRERRRVFNQAELAGKPDLIHVRVWHLTRAQCVDCPQTLFYMITTGINVDASVHDRVVVELGWMYTPSGAMDNVAQM